MSSRLASRPRDERGLPIPFATAVDGDGRPDFTAVSGDRILECCEGNLCGLCGQPLGYWVAFLSGRKAYQARAYVDPPMHEECAEAAIRLCPHIARRPGNGLVGYVPRPPAGFVLDKPDEWVLGVTRSFRFVPQRMVILAAPFVRCRVFAYGDDATLHETDAAS